MIVRDNAKGLRLDETMAKIDEDINNLQKNNWKSWCIMNRVVPTNSDA